MLGRCFILLGVFGACTAPSSDAVESQPIVGGQASPGQNAVVRLKSGGTCSATLLAPNLVLTARHCVAQPPAVVTNFECDASGNPVHMDGTPWLDADLFGNDLNPASILVLSGGQGPAEPVEISATDAVVAHGLQIVHSTDQHHCRTDLALVVLDRGVDDPVTAPLRLTGSTTEGAPLTAVGWGLSAGSEPTAIRQQRDVTVVHVGPASGDFAGDVTVPSHFFSVGESACAGDSGGPALDPQGVIVGVASTLNRPGLFTISSAADCLGSDSRVHYELVSAEADVIMQGFSAAGATPWLEGQPDPRAGLGAFETTCSSGGDCKSNACVADELGALRCSIGCLGDAPSACPSSYKCQQTAGHDRCVHMAAPPDAGDPTPTSESDSGCAVGGGHDAGWMSPLLLAVGLRRRRRT